MHLFSQEEYGLRCLVQLTRQAGGQLRIQDIAEAEGMSPDYVAKLMRALRQGGLVTSIRGASGGYRLARAPEEISIWEAVEVLGGGPLFDDAFCESHPGQMRDCVHTSDCAIRGLWRSVSDLLGNFLRTVTLADLTGQELSPVHWFAKAGRAVA